MSGNILFGSAPFGGITFWGTRIQKSLVYRLVAQIDTKTIKKLLKYEAGYPPTHKHLSLQYRVRLRYEDKYQPKESEYTDKYQPQESEYTDKYVSKGTKYRQKY